MFRYSRFAALVSLLAAIAGCGHAPPATARSLQAVEPLAASADAAPVGRLADFAWLIGRWAGTFNGLPLEESWLAPAAGVMTVAMHLHDGKQPLMLQIGALQETPKGVTFRFRHFTADLTAMEPTPVSLTLVRLDAERAVFENPHHGRPRRTSIIRVGADGARVRSEIEDGTQIVIHEVVLRRL